jgi:transcriptional regulator with XRE-family HTH domain
MWWAFMLFPGSPFHRLVSGGDSMKNLKELRKAAGLTQQHLGQLTNISRIRICHAELGLMKLTRDEVATIRKALVSVSKKSARVLAELSA